MPSYTITNIQPQTDQEGNQKQDSYGNKRWKLAVKDEQGNTIQFNKGFKNEPPQTGSTLTGTLEKKTWDYGEYYQFTAERPQPGGFSSKRDPEVQQSIVRQSSFERAVMIQDAKARIFVAEKKFEDAHKALEFKTITQLSEVIFSYADGHLKVPPATAQNAPEAPSEPGSQGEWADDDLSAFSE